ncbi:hypothetical protein NIES2100_74520 [Calothrix sp. NIES-2100]|uniref:hypothetical protein n=1 Tax=Calothrix sp. NIES-2100 TaxID=1954172 RepID=UPI000B61FF08|nr:hypothetical protein NIES2100_74520 [Calothrix sp. NIES-2100]
MDAAYCLYQTRKNFHKHSREFSLKRLMYNSLIPPWWMIKAGDRRFCVLYRDQNILWKKGIVVWGRIVQANNLLFDPGKWDHPAVIVFSPVPVFDSKLKDLTRIAHDLYELKDKKLNHPEMADFVTFAEAITNEMDCLFNVKIPESLTLNQLVYFTSIMVYRKHLPGGYLKSGWFPILIAPDKTPAAMILPAKYWFSEILDLWCCD